MKWINRCAAALLLSAGCGGPAVLSSGPQPMPDHRVFSSDGTPSSRTELLAAARTAEVVFLGESHNDRVAHQLQLEIFQALLEDPAPARRPVILSLEMFERDVQYIVDEYLRGYIREDHFLRSSRPWPYYEQDYRPLLELARLRGAPVLAANAPRRYVNRVTRAGPDSLRVLSPEALRSLPPLPYAAPSAAYRARVEQFTRPPGDSTPPGTGPISNGMYAQALWDAGMAYSIAEALRTHAGALIVHLVGSFHVRYGLGLPEQLEGYRPGTRRLTVVLQPVADVRTFPADLKDAGDFIILTDAARQRPQEQQLQPPAPVTPSAVVRDP